MWTGTTSTMLIQWNLSKTTPQGTFKMRSLLPGGLLIQGHLTATSIFWCWFQWSSRTGGRLIRAVAFTGFSVVNTVSLHKLTTQTHHTNSPHKLTTQTHHTNSPHKLTTQTHHTNSPHKLTTQTHHTNSPHKLTTQTHHMASNRGHLRVVIFVLLRGVIFGVLGPAQGSHLQKNCRKWLLFDPLV